jgi:hypothetical protein
MIFTDVNLAGKIDGLGTRSLCDAMLPERPRHRHLGSRANEKPAKRGAIHAEAIAATGRAPRGRAFAGLTPRSRRAGGRCVPPAEDRGGYPETAIVVAGKGSDTPDISLDNSVFWSVVLDCWGSDVIRSIETARVYRRAWSIGGMATRGARAAASDACDRLPQ